MPTSMVSVVVGVALLAIAASAVVPSAAQSRQESLIAEALRLQSIYDIAHREAVRTGQPHAVTYDDTTRTFEAFVADISVSPPDNAGTLHHPVTKQPVIYTLPNGIDVSPAPDPFQFGGGVDSAHVIFDAWGMPYNGVPGNHLGVLNGTLAVSNGNSSVRVVINAHTGRVILQ